MRNWWKIWADVTFYKIQSDGSIGAPVLYLDTLKVSTIEQTAENTPARGGKGNPELITWDLISIIGPLVA